jgi:hypothetical protein
VRPRSEAVRKAEAFHSQPMHRRTPGSLAGICPGGANTFPAGVRSPPLRGVAIQARVA